MMSASTSRKLSASEEAARDPLSTFPEFLVREGLLDRHALEAITREIDREVAEITRARAARSAARARLGPPISVFR